MDSVKTFKSNKEDWIAFGEVVGQQIAFLMDRLNGNHAKLSPSLLRDLELLSHRLLSINEKISKAQNRSKWKKFASLREDSSLLASLKEELNDALNLFTVRAISWLDQHREDSPSLRATSPTPPPVQFFYGRNEYITSLVRLIKSGQERAFASHMIINGPGGIGKTSIATALLHHPDVKALFSKHIYFASCESAISESIFLEVMASSFGIKSSSKDVLNDIVQFIQEASSPVFLILDNFETCWLGDQRFEIHQILKQLVALENLTLLLTMRGKDHPPEIRWEKLPDLPMLSLDDARRLFVDITESESPLNALVDDLLRALDCLPLAVTLLAQLVRQGEDIETLHRRWTVQKTSLLNIGDDDRHYSLDKSIKLSLESPPMKKDLCADRLLRVLSDSDPLHVERFFLI